MRDVSVFTHRLPPTNTSGNDCGTVVNLHKRCLERLTDHPHNMNLKYLHKISDTAQNRRHSLWIVIECNLEGSMNFNYQEFIITSFIIIRST